MPTTLTGTLCHVPSMGAMVLFPFREQRCGRWLSLFVISQTKGGGLGFGASRTRKGYSPAFVVPIAGGATLCGLAVPLRSTNGALTNGKYAGRQNRLRTYS